MSPRDPFIVPLGYTILAYLGVIALCAMGLHVALNP